MKFLVCGLGVLLTFGSGQLLAKQAGEAAADTAYHYDEDYYDRGGIDWSRLFDFFLHSQNNLVSHPVVAASGGLSFPAAGDEDIQPPHTNFLGLEYGFVRLDSNYSLRDLRGYSSEFAFIEDNTNQWGPLKATPNNVYANIFSFGVGLVSGFGVRFAPNELYGLHSSAFSWSYVDYSSYPPDGGLAVFDDQWKFGSKGAAVLEYRLGEYCLFDLKYEHINMYSGMDCWPWLGSLGVDFVLQRWIDVLDPLFIREFEYAYPFIKFFYKNAISIIISELRQSNQFYPFASEHSLLERRLTLGLKFVF